MNDWLESWRKLQQQFPPLQSTKVQWGLVGGLLLTLAGWFAWPRDREVPLTAPAPRSAADARAALAQLKQAGIASARLREGQILVPASRLAEAERTLQAASKTAAATARSGDGTATGSFWPTTESQRQEQLDSQRATELVRMFEGDPNIASARLVWNRDRKRSFQQASKTTVVLGVTPREGREVSSELAESLQMAVVSAFGLGGPEDVTLIVNGPQGTRWVRGGAGSTGTTFANRQETARRAGLPEVRSTLDAPQTTPPSSHVTLAEAEEPDAGPAQSAPFAVSDTLTGHSAPAEGSPPQGLPDNPAAQLQARLTEKLAWIPGVRVRVDRISTRLAPHVARRPSRNSTPASTKSPIAPASLLDDPDSSAQRRPYEVVVEIPARVTRTLASSSTPPRDPADPNPAPTRDEVSRRVEQTVQRLGAQIAAEEPLETSVLVLFAEPVEGAWAGGGWLNLTEWTTGLTLARRRWWPLGAGLLVLPAWVWHRRRRAKQLPPVDPQATSPVSATSPSAPSGGTGVIGGATGDDLAALRLARRRTTPREEGPEPESLAAELMQNEPAASVAEIAESTLQQVAERHSGAWPPRFNPPVAPRPAGVETSPTVPASGRVSASRDTTGSSAPPAGDPAGMGRPGGEPAGERAGVAAWRGEAGVGSGEFRMLADCTADEWRQLLADETPQSIACVVARLSAAQATFVLRLLPAAARLEVIRRLPSLELPSASILREFGLALEDRLHSIRAGQAPTAGPATVAGPPPGHAVPTPQSSRSPVGLAARGAIPATLGPRAGVAGAGAGGVSPTTASGAVETGAADAATLANSPEVPVNSPESDSLSELPPAPFGDLRMLDDGALRELFVMFDPSLWAVALAGAPRPVTDKLLGSLDPATAAQLAAAVARVTPAQTSEAAAAQQAIEQRLAPLRWRGRRSSRMPRRSPRP